MPAVNDLDRDHATTVVTDCGRAAQRAAPSLATASEAAINAALVDMARRLAEATVEILGANERDLRHAEDSGMTGALVDRLRLDETRLADMADQIRLLADAPFPVRDRVLRELPGELRLLERTRPVGVIGANFEARPNVTIDIASQLLKSRNAGVLRTGSAALRSAGMLHSEVIAPALHGAGLDPDAIQLVQHAGRETATALVQQPHLIPLVILRGSGESTRALSVEAARNGVRTLAHADGGGVLYVDSAANRELAVELILAGLDRLGVCNRLNLLLVAEDIYDQVVPELVRTLRQAGVEVSLPPHGHPLGHEWALDTGREGTVTVSYAAGAANAAQIANQETSGLAATIVTEDSAAAAQFMDAYAGTGVFWNATTRLLDGFKLHKIPETGINVDHVPGPRGPVTFHDLYLRQYVVVPANPPA